MVKPVAFIKRSNDIEALMTAAIANPQKKMHSIEVLYIAANGIIQNNGNNKELTKETNKRPVRVPLESCQLSQRLFEYIAEIMYNDAETPGKCNCYNQSSS